MEEENDSALYEFNMQRKRSDKVQEVWEIQFQYKKSLKQQGINSILHMTYQLFQNPNTGKEGYLIVTSLFSEFLTLPFHIGFLHNDIKVDVVNAMQYLLTFPTL